MCVGASSYWLLAAGKAFGYWLLAKNQEPVPGTWLLKPKPGLTGKSARATQSFYKVDHRQGVPVPQKS